MTPQHDHKKKTTKKTPKIYRLGLGSRLGASLRCPSVLVQAPTSPFIPASRANVKLGESRVHSPARARAAGSGPDRVQELCYTAGESKGGQKGNHEESKARSEGETHERALLAPYLKGEREGRMRRWEWEE